jgi:hypothetical protein
MVVLCTVKNLFFYTQNHPVPPVKKGSYVIIYMCEREDLTVEINSVPPFFCMGGIHRWYGNIRVL